MTVREALAWAVRQLSTAGVDSPRLSAELLAGKAFGLSRLQLIVEAPAPLTAEALADLEHLVACRAAGEPVAYLLGQREFYGLPFSVTPAVLIPRPETELIVELALARFPTNTPLTFADFGTGSGILAVTLATVFPESRGFAIDVSAEALAVAQANALRLGVAERLQFLRADMTLPLLTAASCQLVVSNPPYVTESEYANVSPEVREFEPRLALVSPEDGLVHLRGLLQANASALDPGGMLLVEIGCGQGKGALRAASECWPGACDCTIERDYAGLDRVLRAGARVA